MTGETDSHRVEYEFGGPIGAILIMLISHVIPYYLWFCVALNNSSIALPSWDMFVTIWEHAQPNAYAIYFYFGFITFEFICAWVIPGFYVLGVPLRHEGGKQYPMMSSNALDSNTTVMLFNLASLMDNFAPVLTVAILVSDAVAVFTYVYTLMINAQHRISGNHIYDFFMGAILNPRLGSVDLKMFTEGRISWILLFLLTSSAALKQYEQIGYIHNSMYFMLTAHGLYTNAIMKGEECICTTWDIFYEKWGWMLIYWNLAGVPFVYCIQSFYILKNHALINPPTWFYYLLYTTLFMAYYVWDASQRQRNTFRMMRSGTYKPRFTFPQLPGGILENPKFLETSVGSELLIDGIWSYARKPHYSADIYMGLTWGLVCGFGSIIPYFYVVFFTSMILHRALRDIDRCEKKYGRDWEKYCKKVPYLFVPGIY